MDKCSQTSAAIAGRRVGCTRGFSVAHQDCGCRAKKNDYSLGPDVLSYNLAIQIQCKAGQLQKAHGLQRVLMQTGLRPTVSTFAPILVAAGQVGDHPAVLRVWAELQHLGIDPDATCCTAFITAASHNGGAGAFPPPAGPAAAHPRPPLVRVLVHFWARLCAGRHTRTVIVYLCAYCSHWCFDTGCMPRPAVLCHLMHEVSPIAP